MPSPPAPYTSAGRRIFHASPEARTISSAWILDSAVSATFRGNRARAYQCEPLDARPPGLGDEIQRAEGIDLVVAGASVRVGDPGQVEHLVAARANPGERVRPCHVGAHGSPAGRQGRLARRWMTTPVMPNRCSTASSGRPRRPGPVTRTLTSGPSAGTRGSVAQEIVEKLDDSRHLDERTPARQAEELCFDLANTESSRRAWSNHLGVDEPVVGFQGQPLVG